MNKKLKYTILTILSCSLFCFAAEETLFYYMNKPSREFSKTHYSEKTGHVYVIPDKTVGYKPVPSVSVSARKYKGKNMLYDVGYTIDKYSRRITPLDKKENRKNAILLFGCSYVYGEGVDDNETLPYFIARYAPGYMPYNYGFSGYGPQQMLAKLQSGSLKREVKGGRKILIYVYMSDHINRLINNFRVHAYEGWGENQPYYAFNTNEGTLARKGNFKSEKPLRSFLMTSLSKSQLVSYLVRRNFLELPAPDDRDVALMLRIIAESRDIFKEEFHSDDFFVVFFPQEVDDYHLLANLRKLNIKCLDYIELMPDAYDHYCRVHEFDPHPNAKLYDMVAKKLAEDIRIE